MYFGVIAQHQTDFNILKMVSAIVIANSHRNGASILKVIINRESS